jgi:hypothetical protein
VLCHCPQPLIYFVNSKPEHVDHFFHGTRPLQTVNFPDSLEELIRNCHKLLRRYGKNLTTAGQIYVCIAQNMFSNSLNTKFSRSGAGSNIHKTCCSCAYTIYGWVKRALEPFMHIGNHALIFLSVALFSGCSTTKPPTHSGHGSFIAGTTQRPWGN